MELSGMDPPMDNAFQSLIESNVVCVKKDDNKLHYFVHPDYATNCDDETIKLNFDCDLYF